MTVLREIAVEIAIGEEVLRGIRAALDEILLAAGELQIVFADVVQTALRAEVTAGLVRRSHAEAARQAVAASHGRAAGTVRDGDLFAFDEGDFVVPRAGLVRREMRAPLVAGTGGGVRGIAIGGEVARHLVTGCTGGVRERHVHPVIGERIRVIVRLARLRSVERERDFVPLLKFAADHGGGVELDSGGAQRDRQQNWL